MTTRKLIVTGASGQLGRRVVEILLEKQLANTTVIGTTRSPDKIADLAKRGAEIRKADFDDPASLRAAFKGGERLLLISTDAVAVAGQRVAQQKAAVEAAVEAGVKHIIYISLVRADPHHPIRFVTDHVITEAAIATSKVEGYTIVRTGFWFETLFYSLPSAIPYGTFAGSQGDGRINYVAREETAIVAAAELASDRTGRSYVSATGPAALSMGEVCKIVGDTIGKPLTYQPISREAKTKMLTDFGVPAPFIKITTDMEAAAAEGWLADVALPHPAIARRQTAAEWIAQHKGAFLAQK